MKTLLSTFFILSASFLYAQAEQDSILLLNGKVYKGKILGLEEIEGDSILKYETSNKKGAKHVEDISTYRIFSYTQFGKKKVLYHQDEFSGNYLSVRETKEVTLGSYDARQTFKAHVPFWSGFALGLGASLFDTYLTKKEAQDSTLLVTKDPGFFRNEPSIFPFLVPPVISVAWSLPTFKLRGRKMIHKQYLHNEFYYRGYHRIAKQKRMLGSLLGSFSGVALGMILHYSISPHL